MQVEFLTNLADRISPQSWNELAGTDYPFLRYEFLAALELSGSVSVSTGWQARHLLMTDGDTAVAAMPLYLKTHSWGEYVFDQSWAQAYRQHGLAYYPKLLTSVPFTPCCGPRLAVRAGADRTLAFRTAFTELTEFAADSGISSWHCLFPDDELRRHCVDQGLILREDVQFHWFNRGYRSFEDFLAVLTADKRKMIRRERRKVAEQGISLVQLRGADISGDNWRDFYRFYALTYRKRRSQPYLNPAFFNYLAATMPEQLLLVLAFNGRAAVAASLFFVGSDTLYGRYWGCGQDYDALHFEACYYRGIEFCIEQGLSRFDSGAQGEHKIARGFEPVSTFSAHWLHDARFSQAVAGFVRQERQQLSLYKADAATFLPFKRGVGAD